MTPPTELAFPESTLLPGSLVEVAVADEVVDLRPAATQPVLEACQDGAFQALQLDQATLMVIAERLVKTLALLLDVRLVGVAGLATITSNLERRPDRLQLERLGRLERSKVDLS